MWSVPYPPNLAGKTEEEKITLLCSYLWQLAEQLNWAMGQLRVDS